MLRLESQTRWQAGVNDFRDTNVRRLHGQLIDIKGYATSACEKIEQLMDQQKFDISVSELKELISYELMQLGLSDWQGL